MKAPIPVSIAGAALSGPEPDLNMALDEMIYNVTSSALQKAGLSISDISGACMAASDVADGRAISTMTLTGSTGSFHKSEMRVCNDSLAAIQLGWAEVASGAADALMVCSWSKLSDARSESIRPLAMEPSMHRALGYSPDAVLALRTSAEQHRPTTVATVERTDVDVAGAMVLVRTGHYAAGPAKLVGFGASMGRYLAPGEPVLQPVQKAFRDACDRAGVSPTELESVIVAGMPAIDDGEFARAFGVSEGNIARPEDDRFADLGYAAGITGVLNTLDRNGDGLSLIVSGGGLGYENAHAVVVEVS
ncbi:hypothetical protein [Rhodococcus qingshengii]|uniref:hypothetical protein n=1 Tax=Rhodococcus qingshengii TaxID=334542 RepID=UPI001E33D00C|nr:hypothetical protein [Rhodococcus qingshengii]MCQ4150591.1 hypothetical protein [Rhodococcus qingshengii]UGQ55421.1 hypothetical protein LRL17_31240 [Rhodococcus qingshengii]